MGGFVEKYFKVYGSIIREVTTTKDKIKTVYVNLGYDDPIKEGLRLDVMECETIEGNYTERKIGEIRIKEILGGKISIGKVYEGEKNFILK